MRARTIVVWLGVLAALVVMIGEPATATRNWPRLQVSKHGQAWSSAVRVPLFEPAPRLVPGETAVRSFLVRNTSRERMHVQMQFRVRDPAGWVRTGRRGDHDADRLRFAVRVLHRWRAVHPSTWTWPHLQLAPGQQKKVEVRVRLTRRSQERWPDAHVTFRVRLFGSPARPGRVSP